MGRRGNDWWNAPSSTDRRSSRYSSSSSTSGHQKSIEAGEDLAKTIKEDNPLLGPLLTTAAIAVTTIGDSFGKSFVKVIDWGWPHE